MEFARAIAAAYIVCLFCVCHLEGYEMDLAISANAAEGERLAAEIERMLADPTISDTAKVGA